jgi:hypothetical protein
LISFSIFGNFKLNSGELDFEVHSELPVIYPLLMFESEESEFSSGSTKSLFKALIKSSPKNLCKFLSVIFRSVEFLCLEKRGNSFTPFSLSRLSSFWQSSLSSYKKHLS